MRLHPLIFFCLVSAAEDPLLVVVKIWVSFSDAAKSRWGGGGNQRSITEKSKTGPKQNPPARCEAEIQKEQRMT